MAGDVVPITGSDEISDIDIDKLRERVSTLRARENLSWAKIEAEGGPPAGTFSSWFNGNYKGNNAAIAEKVEQWLENRSERADFRAGAVHFRDWVETPTSKSIWKRLEYAHHLDVMGMISGGPGIGKTTTFKRYAAQKSLVKIVTMNPAVRSPLYALRHIRNAFNLGDQHTSPFDMRAQIVRKLKGTESLLVIDEAQELSDAGIEIIRSIYDEAGIAVILAGNETLYRRFNSVGVDSVHAQVRSRASFMLHLRHPSDEDIRSLLHARGVTDAAAFKLLKTVALRPGALRLLDETISLAQFLSETPEITNKAIRAAYQELTLSGAA